MTKFGRVSRYGGAILGPHEDYLVVEGPSQTFRVGLEGIFVRCQVLLET